MTDPFPSLGVPEGATLDGPVEYLGSSEPGLGILVAQYTSLVNGFSYYIGHPISDGTQCIPIMTSVATIQPLEEVITESVDDDIHCNLLFSIIGTLILLLHFLKTLLMCP